MLGAALCLCAPAGASAAFTAPVQISDAGQQTLRQEISVAGSGRAAAIWQTLTEIRLAWGTTTAGFSPSIGVATGAFFDLTTPAVGLDSTGRATAAWSCGSCGGIEVALAPYNGAFGAPVHVSNAADSFGADPAIAVAPNGDAVLAWVASSGGQDYIDASFRTGAGAFTAAQRLSPKGNGAVPRVAIDGAGNAIVAFTSSDGSNVRAAVSSRPAGAGSVFSAPAFVSPAGENVATVDAGCAPTAPGGDCTVVWHVGGSLGPGDVIKAATRAAAAGAFGAPQTLSSAGQPSRVPDVEVDATHRATAVWLHSLPFAPYFGWTPEASSAPAGGSFGAVTNIGTASNNSGASFVEIGTSLAGNAVVVWDSGANGIWASERSTSGAYGAPVSLGGAGATALRPHVGLDDAGNCIVTWSADDGPGQQAHTVVFASRCTGPPPVPHTTRHKHLVTVNKVERQVDLDPGQTRTVTLSCPLAGAIMTDGSARVDAVDQGTGTLASVEVRQARSSGVGSYVFTLVNHATGRAQTKVFGTCLNGRTSTAQGHSHAISTTGPVTQAVTWPAGFQTATLTCAPGQVAISPGFELTSGAALWRRSEPSDPAWSFGFEVTSPATANLSVRCLDKRVAQELGHTHKLKLRHRAKTVSVPAHATRSYSVSCPDDAKGIVASYDLPAGVLLLGHDPQPKIRVFKLLNTTGSAQSATLDLTCIGDRTGPKTH